MNTTAKSGTNGQNLFFLILHSLRCFFGTGRRTQTITADPKPMRIRDAPRPARPRSGVYTTLFNHLDFINEFMGGRFEITMDGFSHTRPDPSALATTLDCLRALPTNLPFLRTKAASTGYANRGFDEWTCRATGVMTDQSAQLRIRQNFAVPHRQTRAGRLTSRSRRPDPHTRRERRRSCWCWIPARRPRTTR